MDRLFARLLSTLNMLASLWILALIALISADVIGRSFFDNPLPGVPEIVKFSIVGMVWLQMAYVLRSGGHLRTTLGLDAMPRPAAKSVMVLNMLAGLAIFAMVSWYGSGEMLQSWRVSAFEGAEPVRIPTWPIWAIVVVGSALTAIQCVIEIGLILRGRDASSDVPHGTDSAPDDGVA